MEINLYKNSTSNKTRIFGDDFDIDQLSGSIMYLDNNQIGLNKSLWFLENDREYHILILLKGRLTNTSYMFERCENMVIKFTHNKTESGGIFDKSKIITMESMFNYSSNITVNLSFFYSKNVVRMDHMFSHSY